MAFEWGHQLFLVPQQLPTFELELVHWSCTFWIILHNHISQFLVSLFLFFLLPDLLEQGPTLMTTFNLSYLLKGPIVKHSNTGGLGFNRWIG